MVNIIPRKDEKNEFKRYILVKGEESEFEFSFFITNPIFFHLISSAERMAKNQEKYFTTVMNYLEALVGGSEAVIEINEVYESEDETYDLETLIEAIMGSIDADVAKSSEDADPKVK